MRPQCKNHLIFLCVRLNLSVIDDFALIMGQKMNGKDINRIGKSNKLVSLPEGTLGNLGNV